MIHIQNASRWYQQVIGVNDISCQIGAGMTALLGPNGAGKSTLLKLITGQLRPTTGQIEVLGLKPFANPNVYKRLGYCPEIENNYDDMTGVDFVTMLGSMAGIPSRELKDRVLEAIDLVGMTENAGRKIGGYSKGMRQRIKVAQGIIHNPEVVVLDEPLNGLDPVGRREMMRVFEQLAGQGKCVLVSSHILYEVEQMTSNILLMNRGRLVAQGNIYQIRGLIDSHPHKIVITTPEPRRLAKRLLDFPYILSVHFSTAKPEEIEIETRSPNLFYHEFPTIVLQEDFVISRFESPDNNLEAVFKYLIQG
jgi:ABC-2 type transport system ATP-binding protein